MIAGYISVAILSLLTILSLRTLIVLGPAALWTSAGWLLTIAYDCAASTELLAHRHMPFHLPYIFLLGLIVAFTVAGVRDERQGEPWWWPIARTKTRAERRAA